MSGALAMLMLVLRLVVVPDAGVGESELERDLEIYDSIIHPSSSLSLHPPSFQSQYKRTGRLPLDRWTCQCHYVHSI